MGSENLEKSQIRVLFYILNDADLLDPLLDRLSQAGVRGCTIFDSSGMGRQLAKKQPDAFNALFGIGSVLGNFGLSNANSKTLMMLLRQDKIDSVVSVIEQVVGDLSVAGSGILFSFAPDMIKGLKL